MLSSEVSGSIYLLFILEGLWQLEKTSLRGENLVLVLKA